VSSVLTYFLPKEPVPPVIRIDFPSNIYSSLTHKIISKKFYSKL
jgi:hypothetical protein